MARGSGGWGEWIGCEVGAVEGDVEMEMRWVEKERVGGVENVREAC